MHSTTFRRVAVTGGLIVLLAGCTPGTAPVVVATETAPGSSTPPATPTASAPRPTQVATPTNVATPTQGVPPTADTAAPTAAPTADTRTQVAVAITTALWNPATQAVEVGSFVPVVEEGGRCTLTLTSGAATVTAEGEALPDASSTSCGLLTVAGSDLTPGTWHVELSYESTRTHGRSQAQSVEVP